MKISQKSASALGQIPMSSTLQQSANHRITHDVLKIEAEEERDRRLMVESENTALIQRIRDLEAIVRKWESTDGFALHESAESGSFTAKKLAEVGTEGPACSEGADDVRMLRRIVNLGALIAAFAACTVWLISDVLVKGLGSCSCMPNEVEDN